MPGKSHGWRSLVGCSPWGGEELHTIERLHFHFSLLCIGEGNGNPLQCSCLENSRDDGAWWAAICGVAQSQTQLKRLSSSSILIFVLHAGVALANAHMCIHICCCSVIQSCLTLFDSMDCSTPGFPVLHHLTELAQTHVH